MLIFCDGYDHYTTTQATSGQKWDTVANVTIGATYARTGGQGAKLAGSGAKLFKAVTASATYTIGTAVWGQIYNAAGSLLHSFNDGATNQISVVLADLIGTIQLWRGPTLIATATPKLAINQYRYLETQVFVDPSVGTVVVRLDGAPIITFSGNTRVSGVSQITVLGLGPIGNSQEFWFDDTYVCDATTPNTAGNNNSTFLGDVKVTALYPNAAGAFTQYTRGGTNTGQDYSQVNEATPDEDTTYIVDSTVNDRDSFKFTFISLVGSIFAAVLWSRARKDDASVRTLANMVRSSAIDQVGANYNLASAYQYYGTVFEVDPATTALWTTTGLNLAEFGVKTIA